MQLSPFARIHNPPEPLVLRICAADSEVPRSVVAGLAADGIDVQDYRPRQITPEMLESAAVVVLCGCDMPPFGHPVTNLERWDDIPMVSDGYERARDALVRRVAQLL